MDNQWWRHKWEVEGFEDNLHRTCSRCGVEQWKTQEYSWGNKGSFEWKPKISQRCTKAINPSLY